MSTGAPLNGPCSPWAAVEDIRVCASCSDDISATEAQYDQALEAASWVLWALSGRQFAGECSTVIRPCCVAELGNGSYGIWSPFDSISPHLVAGSWYNVVGCGSPCVGWECGQEVPRIDLGDQFPVTGITEVMIDGVALDPDAYRLDTFRYLTRVDGDRWPTAQNLLDEDTQPGTWSIEVTHGQPPPTMGVMAAAELACQLLLAACNPDKCVLPKRVVQTARQGVTYNMTDIMEVVKERRTGLYSVDLFAGVANPNDLPFASAIRTPDRARHNRVL